MGRALNDLHFKPDLIISSSALRARSTADAVAKEVGHHQPIRVESKLYEAGHGMITGILQGLSTDVNSVMVFGHNPILEQLVVYLLQMRGAIVIPTSGMVCLEVNVHNWASLQPGECALKWFMIPKLLA